MTYSPVVRSTWGVCDLSDMRHFHVVLLGESRVPWRSGIRVGRTSMLPESVMPLGVGKNAVLSIRYWMQAFNVCDGNGEFGPSAFRSAL